MPISAQVSARAIRSVRDRAGIMIRLAPSACGNRCRSARSVPMYRGQDAAARWCEACIHSDRGFGLTELRLAQRGGVLGRSAHRQTENHADHHIGPHIHISHKIYYGTKMTLENAFECNGLAANPACAIICVAACSVCSGSRHAAAHAPAPGRSRAGSRLATGAAGSCQNGGSRAYAPAPRSHPRVRSCDRSAGAACRRRSRARDRASRRRRWRGFPRLSACGT